MIISHNQYSIDFLKDVNLNDHDSVGISLSGGTDSTMVFYLLCKYAPQLSIVPFTMIEEGHPTARPNNIWHVDEICLYMKEKFPKVNIKDVKECKFNPKDPILYKEALDHIKRKIVSGIEPYGYVKSLATTNFRNKLIDAGEFSLVCSGISMNPPVEDQKKYMFTRVEPRRNQSKDNVTNIKNKIVLGKKIVHHNPFINSHKKVIAAFYHKYNLMDDLFPLTSSCVGTATTTDFFTKPCEVCFWCQEKMWAFGYYDGKLPSTANNPWLKKKHQSEVGINVDITHRCLLQCHKCLRQQFPKMHMRGRDISLKAMKKLLDSYIPKINFCGQMGDCIYHPKFLDILKLCTQYKDKGFIFHTNGSHKSNFFWNQVIKIYKNQPQLNHKWWIALDGLPAQSHIYRVNQDGQAVWEVMKRLAKYTNVYWQYIVFKYNEDNLDKAAKMAKENNITFVKLISSRWDKNDLFKPSLKYTIPSKHELHAKKNKT